MKRIIVVFTAVHFPAHLRSFAARLSKETGAALQAVILPYAESSLQYPFPSDLPLTATAVSSESPEEENLELEWSMWRLFQDECVAMEVSASLAEVETLKELLEHSRSCDLLLTDPEVAFQDFSLEDVLAHAHCPVFVSGYNAPLVEEVLLAYDTSDESKYAIKTYAALIPQWAQLPTYLVSVNAAPVAVLEEREFIGQWLPKHFTNLEIKFLEGNVKEALLGFLHQHAANTLVVMGAYSRGEVSRFFHPSTADAVLKQTRLSLFVAHPE